MTGRRVQPCTPEVTSVPAASWVPPNACLPATSPSGAVHSRAQDLSSFYPKTGRLKPMKNSLDSKKEQLLKAVVKKYIHTASPVASLMLRGSDGLEASSA